MSTLATLLDGDPDDVVVHARGEATTRAALAGIFGSRRAQ